MMIRKAQMNDLDSIETIIKDVKEKMHSINNYQWGNDYPNLSDFKNDIKDESLYVYVDKDNEIKGLICINFEEPPEYNNLNWSLNEKAIILHRMAVSINSRKQGIASALMQFAEDIALMSDIHYIRTDTYSSNEKMQGLFKKLGYSFIGEIAFQERPHPFYCYDKQLSK